MSTPKKASTKKTGGRSGRLKNGQFIPGKQSDSKAITMNSDGGTDMETIRKTADSNNITIRDGKATLVYFRGGVEIGAEHVG